MKLIWKAPAIEDLIELRNYIAEDNPAAAARVATHLNDSAERLIQDPYSGRTGSVEGTRELVVTKYPYILVYEPKEGQVDILRVIHTSRLWPNTEG